MKTIRHRFSKHLFPTTMAGDSTGRTLSKGQDLAEKELRQRVDRRLGPLTRRHTKCHWIFDEQVGK